MATKLGKLTTFLVGLHLDSHAIFNCKDLPRSFGKLKTYIFTIAIPLTLDRIMKHNEEFPLIKLYDPWITWFCEVEMFIKTEKISGVNSKKSVVDNKYRGLLD